MGQEKESKISDVIKKVVNTGIGAAFMTEEAIKEKLGDLSVSKDFLNGLLQNAKTTRDEFIGAVKKELKDLVGSVNVTEEIKKVVENYDIEVSATFRFHPKKSSDKRSKIEVNKKVKKKAS